MAIKYLYTTVLIHRISQKIQMIFDVLILLYTVSEQCSVEDRRIRLLRHLYKKVKEVTAHSKPVATSNRCY